MIRPVQRPTLHVLGAGHLGRSLARLWHRRGMAEIATVLCRSEASAAEAVRFIGAGCPSVDTPVPQAPALYLLSVPDDAIAHLVARLQDAGDWSGTVCFHCSGALSSEVLRPLRASGASVASAHPLRSFADPAVAARDFAGTWCGVEGDPSALHRVGSLFEGAGAHCVALRADGKSAYHAGAVVASNYVVALLDMALHLFEQAGIERQQALQLIAPLSRGTLQNVLTHGPAASLSGPILRGDGATVAAQLEVLARPEHQAAYRALGRVALDLARQRGLAEPEALDRIDTLLGNAPRPD